MKKLLIALALAASLPAHADRLDAALRMVDDEISSAYWQEAKIYKASCAGGSPAACSLYRNMLERAKQRLLTIKSQQRQQKPQVTIVNEPKPWDRF